MRHTIQGFRMLKRRDSEMMLEGLRKISQRIEVFNYSSHTCGQLCRNLKRSR